MHPLLFLLLLSVFNLKLNNFWADIRHTSTISSTKIRSIFKQMKFPLLSLTVLFLFSDFVQDTTITQADRQNYKRHTQGQNPTWKRLSEARTVMRGLRGCARSWLLLPKGLCCLYSRLTKLRRVYHVSSLVRCKNYVKILRDLTNGKLGTMY